MVTEGWWVHMHVGQMRVNSPIPAFVASCLHRIGLLENLPCWTLCSILEAAMFAAGLLQKRCNFCLPGGVHVLLLRNRTHCLTPSVESHSSGQQMLADCPLEAALEPDRMSHISTSSHRPLFLSAASLSTLFCAPLKGLKREK